MNKVLQDKNRLAMLLFIASEATFFAVLIAAYIYFHAVTTPGPNAKNSLHPATAGIFTLFLLSSSVTVWLAGRSVERDNRRGATIWLIATVVLGGVFLVGQGREYISLIADNVTVASNVFGSTFFTLTGFHGLHVFLGLVALAILALIAFQGDFRGGRATPIEVVSIYWHFVDAVWIVIFSMIYLWPLFT
ncbi:MAG: heme-copper oxidase subunit III [Chloroflexia bacterium]|jgi:heme/copper-type cytochrome/quinol oxidase subunit 3